MTEEILTGTEKRRVFIYMGQTYEDPGESVSNEAVLEIMSRTYGNLAGGSVEVEEKDGVTEVTLKPRPKQLGAGLAPGLMEFLQAMIDADPALPAVEMPEIPDRVTLRELWELVEIWYLSKGQRNTAGRQAMRMVSICSKARPVPSAGMVLGV